MDSLLIPDVIKHFLTILTDEDTWYHLTIASDNFKKYAYSNAGINAFIKMLGIDEEVNVARKIGSHGEEAWFKMTLINEKFKKYAYSKIGVREYCNLFIVKQKTLVNYGLVNTYFINNFVLPNNNFALPNNNFILPNNNFVIQWQ